MRPVTRREALGELAASLGAVALGELAASLGAVALVAGCGERGRRSGAAGGSGRGASAPGSTLVSTWADPDGTGTLVIGPGELPSARTELGEARALGSPLATLAHLTDAHVLDAASPARVPFLDRLGPPFQSTFRPQDTLTAQVLAGALAAVRGLGPDAVIEGGDLIDNDQDNELVVALAALRGGPVRPGSARGYVGVQSAGDGDPFYYRPAIDAPRHPALLRAAMRGFSSPGTGCRWHPVLGDHDILVAGEIPPSARTRALAVGDQALWEVPPGLRAPSGPELTTGLSPDGPPAPGLVDSFLAKATAGPRVRVPRDPSRRELSAAEVIERLRRASGGGVMPTDRAEGSASGGLFGAALTPALGLTPGAPSLDYHADVGPGVRVIVLDLARRAGGSGGLVRPGHPAWLERELAAAGERWIVVASHQPLRGAEGGQALLSLLDAHPRVIATLAGHTHRNRIEPRRAAGSAGYWMIETASLIDFPQQARALRVRPTAGGGVALEAWMLDHIFPGQLGVISRQLAYLDAQGGRPAGFSGRRGDRNVVLYRRAP